MARGRFVGKFQEMFSSYDQDFREATEIVVVGLGKEKNYKRLCFRKVSAKIVEIAKAAKAKRVRVLLESFTGGEVSLLDTARIFPEMLILSQYDFDRYKTKKKEESTPKKIFFQSLLSQKSAVANAKKLEEKSRTITKGVVFARDLINEPGNVMNSQQLAKEARAFAEKKGFHCQILGETVLKSLKMNGILAVNQGSKTP